MAMGRSESHVREELLAAADEVIEDAVVDSDLTALRGLLYQLTGDDEVAPRRTPTTRRPRSPVTPMTPSSPAQGRRVPEGLS